MWKGSGIANETGNATNMVGVCPDRGPPDGSAGRGRSPMNRRSRFRVSIDVYGAAGARGQSGIIQTKSRPTDLGSLSDDARPLRSFPTAV